MVLWIDVKSSAMLVKDKILGKCMISTKIQFLHDYCSLISEYVGLDHLSEVTVERQYPILAENDRDEVGTITLKMSFTSAIVCPSRLVN